jgi:hypothetical protein
VHFLATRMRGIHGSVVKHSATMLLDTGSGPLFHSGRRRLAAEAIPVDRHIHYEDTVTPN